MTVPWVDDDLRALVGATIDASGAPATRYRLDSILGEGGTGVAFFAVRIEERGESPHVVKLFRPALVLKAPEIADVSKRKELGAMKRINERVPPSPYIVRMVDSGELRAKYKEMDVTLPWIASEYVNGGLEGTTLTERITRGVEATGVGFDPERALRVLRCIVEGVAVIHSLGVIHRDIKPDNILLCGFAEDEIAKITDFGVARGGGLEATFGPQPVGTIGYAAPEQLGLVPGAATSEATDVFSLGVLLYKMLTAEDYFRKIPFAQLARRRDDGGPDPRPRLRDATRLHPEIKNATPQLDAIDEAIRKATMVRPEARFPNARELRAAVDAPLRTLVRPKTTRDRRSKTRERLRTIMMQAPSRLTWTPRHRPGGDRVLRGVAWEPDGRALGVGQDGLAYWDGRNWFPVQSPPALAGALHFVVRVDAGHFLMGGAGGVLAQLTEQGWGKVGQPGDPRLVFEHAAGHPEATLVISATLSGAPYLYVSDQGNWRPALALTQAAAINGVAQVDESHWILVGRAAQGGALVLLYDARTHAVTPYTVPNTRALLAVAADRDGNAFAVGPAALAVAIRPDGQGGLAVQVEPATTERDLSSVAIDPVGNAWATAQGRVIKRVTQMPGGPGRWEAVHAFDWLVPAIGCLAAGGSVFAVTVDGAILEGREERVEIVPPSSIAPGR